MKCFSPVKIRDPVEPDSKRYIEVPCGRCVACLSNRRQEWISRIYEEVKISTGCYFVTLTYTDEHLKYGEVRPTLYKKDVQLFIKRFRKNTGMKIRYFAVGEYGSKTLRPHYHLIMFNLGTDKIRVKYELFKAWKDQGMVHVGDVTMRSISYTAKYMLNKFEHDYSGHQSPFMVCSKGIGSVYVAKRKKWHDADLSRQYLVRDGGTRAILPRYYVNKLFDKRQKLKIKKLREKYSQSIEVNLDKWAEDVRLEVCRKQSITQTELNKLKSKSRF